MDEGNYQLYRHAQPAPVVPLPDAVSVLLNHLEDVLPDDAFNLIDVKLWNAVSMLTCPDACRFAMLQAEPVKTANKLGNSPVIPGSYVMVPKEPTKEIVISAMQDNETREVAEIYELMVAAAPQPSAQ
ncbi:TPA: hypothetical protein ACPUG2_004467 [Klebsiella pneumoniae]